MPEAVRTTTSQPGAAARSRGSAASPSRPGIERSSRTRSGWSSAASPSASAPSAASPTTSKPPCASSDASASRVRGWSSTTRIRSAMSHSSAASFAADEGDVQRNAKDTFESWLVGELLLVALLGSATALFLTNPALRNTYELPEGRLVLDTAVVLAATIVAILAGRPLLGRGAGARPAARCRILRRGRRHARVLGRARCSAARTRTRPRPGPRSPRACSRRR